MLDEEVEQLDVVEDVSDGKVHSLMCMPFSKGLRSRKE